MTFPRLILILAIVLFGSIGIAAFFKGKTSQKTKATEIVLGTEVREVPIAITPPTPPPAAKTNPPLQKPRSLPQADRIAEFFNRGTPQFPIVQTVSYKSRVTWLQGRPAWLADYSNHFHTSRHFIARSLNGKPDYYKQDIVEGDRFNVLNPDRKIEFYLLVDVPRAKMWFYYLDQDTKERVLVKNYDVGVGRLDSASASGYLTPLGKYTLGERTAVFKPKMMGFHNGQRIEMMTVFGTRWIPFEGELEGCTAPAKGFGLHGTPWIRDESSGKFADDSSGLGRHVSDGCIRIATTDMEELYSIIISRPTTVELVRDYFDADLPGEEEVSINS